MLTVACLCVPLGSCQNSLWPGWEQSLIILLALQRHRELVRQLNLQSSWKASKPHWAAHCRRWSCRKTPAASPSVCSGSAVAARPSWLLQSCSLTSRGPRRFAPAQKLEGLMVGRQGCWISSLYDSSSPPRLRPSKVANLGRGGVRGPVYTVCGRVVTKPLIHAQVAARGSPRLTVSPLTCLGWWRRRLSCKQQKASWYGFRAVQGDSKLQGKLWRWLRQKTCSLYEPTDGGGRWEGGRLWHGRLWVFLFGLEPLVQVGLIVLMPLRYFFQVADRISFSCESHLTVTAGVFLSAELRHRFTRTCTLPFLPRVRACFLISNKATVFIGALFFSQARPRPAGACTWPCAITSCPGTPWATPRRRASASATRWAANARWGGPSVSLARLLQRHGEMGHEQQLQQQQQQICMDSSQLNGLLLVCCCGEIDSFIPGSLLFLYILNKSFFFFKSMTKLFLCAYFQMLILTLSRYFICYISKFSVWVFDRYMKFETGIILFSQTGWITTITSSK